MNVDYYKKYEPLFGAWYITEKLGEGSYGTVYKIERSEFGVSYNAALKAITIPRSQNEVKAILSEGQSEADASKYFHSVVEELVKEFALMSQMKGQSNIVSYEDHKVIEHTDGIGWDILIRMELLTPLDDYALANPLREQDVIKLGIDLCKALEICQKHKIIHRDIKPENIFVSPTGDYKLGDFGIARVAEKTTGASTRVGTNTYMAPEVYRGDHYNSNVDIYSLGIVMYRLMNRNRLPFYPPAPQPINYQQREAALMKRISGAELPNPIDADWRLAEIIRKACAFDAEKRYESPIDMRHQLEALQIVDGNADKGQHGLNHNKEDSASSDGDEEIYDIILNPLITLENHEMDSGRYDSLAEQDAAASKSAEGGFDETEPFIDIEKYNYLNVKKQQRDSTATGSQYTPAAHNKEDPFDIVTKQYSEPTKSYKPLYLRIAMVMGILAVITVAALNLYFKNRADRINADLKTAHSFHEEGNTQGVIEYSNKVLKIVPDNSEALLLLAEAKYESGQYEEARSTYDMVSPTDYTLLDKEYYIDSLTQLSMVSDAIEAIATLGLGDVEKDKMRCQIAKTVIGFGNENAGDDYKQNFNEIVDQLLTVYYNHAYNMSDTLDYSSARKLLQLPDGDTELFNVLPIYIDITSNSKKINDDLMAEMSSDLSTAMYKCCRNKNGMRLSYAANCMDIMNSMESSKAQEVISNLGQTPFELLLDDLTEDEWNKNLTYISEMGNEFSIMAFNHWAVKTGFTQTFQELQSLMQNEQYSEVNTRLWNWSSLDVPLWFQDDAFVVSPVSTTIALRYYPDEGLYWGEVSNGARNGQGTQIMLSDSSKTMYYSGEWSQNIANGYGEFHDIDSNGTTYWISGNYTDGLENGAMTLSEWSEEYGTITMPFTSQNGRRTYIRQNGSEYVFAEDKKTGRYWYNSNNDGVNGIYPIPFN